MAYINGKEILFSPVLLDNGNLKALIEGSIVDLVIPEGTTKVQAQKCRDCTSLKSVKIPDSVTEIGQWSFGACESLASVTFGNGVESIDTFAFYLCAMSELVFPDSLKTIGVNAFRWCPNLTSVTFGKGLTTIEAEAFWDCGNCTLYDFSKCESVPTLVNANALDRVPSLNAKIIAPSNKYFEWKTASNWVTYESYITYPEGKIPFTICGIYNGYEANEGMTWREWVNSIGYAYGYTLTGDSDTAGVLIPESVSGSSVELWVTDTDSGSYEPVQANQTIKCTHYTGY